MFLELFDFEFFFLKRNNFSEFYIFSKKMLVANFIRFRRKRGRWKKWPMEKTVEGKNSRWNKQPMEKTADRKKG